MTIDDFLGSSEGNIITVEKSVTETSTTYENFYEPPYHFIFNGIILIVCLVYVLKGMFTLINCTR